MNPFTLRATILLIVLSAIIALMRYIPGTFGSESSVHVSIALHGFNLGYYLFTLFSHRFLVRSSERPGAAFTTAFMGMVTGKLLLTMAALGIHLYLVEEGRAIVGVGVFLLYMAYTILEVAYLQKVLRR